MGKSTKMDESFTRVPNELFEALLRQSLRITQLKAALYIIRKTYGFNKQDDDISISQMAEDTGLTRRAMVNAVHDLAKMGIVKLGTVHRGRRTSMKINDIEYWDKEI